MRQVSGLVTDLRCPSARDEEGDPAETNAIEAYRERHRPIGGWTSFCRAAASLEAHRAGTD